MDAMGVQYHYEPEAYDLDGVCYLPDFWLPGQRAHLEIKGQAIVEEDGNKLANKLWRLADLSGRPVFCMFGPPEPVELHESGSSAAFFGFSDGHRLEDDNYVWCECPHCHIAELQFDGRADRIRCSCPRSYHGDKGYNYASQRLLAAYHRAMGFRFDNHA